ncbi:GntR family transcriptional regulator, partial [Streptomyces sp. NPDC012794]|uniref:GntR family transcriptional regulator n=1 Tax=Streptomyces sp. NPDC012794 TaxID=3364850 RepID=UPI00367B1F3A
MGAAVGGDKAVPRYLQIAEDIIQQVRAGVLKPGDQVPSEAEMAECYGVSGGTVRKAMLEIRASGLVDTRHGKGSYVKDRPPVRHRSSDRFRRSGSGPLLVVRPRWVIDRVFQGALALSQNGGSSL